MDRDHCPASPIGPSTGAVSGCQPSARGVGEPEPRSGAGTASTSWPHVSGLELGSLPTAVGCARAHTRLVLAEWSLTALIDDAAVLVSELVTNGLKASWRLADNPPIVLRLLADDRRLLIEVWDQAVTGYDLTPRHDPSAEHGRGLAVVAALSKRWGCAAAQLQLQGRLVRA